MATRRLLPLLDDLARTQQIQDIRTALGDFVAIVDTDALLRPIAVERERAGRAAFTEAPPTLDPPLSATIIDARRENW